MFLMSQKFDESEQVYHGIATRQKCWQQNGWEPFLYVVIFRD